MDNWNEEIDLEAILREYGGEQDVTFPEPEADAAEAAEPKFEFPHEIGERGEPDFDAFNLSFDMEPEDDVRVYSPASAEDAEDDGERQMGGKRIRLLHRRPAILISNKRLHQEHGC